MQSSSPGGSSSLPAPPPAELQDAVTAMMRAGRVPGLSLAVVHRDGVLCAAGFGTADLAGDVPATPGTAYPWFSMTKPVTATAVMALAETGRLDLQAPVDDYVDFLRSPGTSRPTVEQLLTHTAGLSNPLPIRWVHPAGAPPPSAGDLLRRLMRRRRAYRYPVGERARYSNVGYLALGRIVEVVTGAPFESCLRETVLDPAGMTRTGFAYREDAAAATGSLRAPRLADPLLRLLLPRGVVGSRTGAHLGLRPFYVDGPAYGGLVGDVLDAGRFLRLHLGDGRIDGRRVLSADAARAMRTIEHPGRPFDHGIGWFRGPGPGSHEWVEHYGTGAGFWNVMRLYPDRGLGIVVMANSTTAYDVGPVLARLAAATWA
ncbi:serine hydrolase domain-containing protein [Kocuria himachalensis]